MNSKPQAKTSIWFWPIQLLVLGAIVFAGYTVHQNVNELSHVPQLSNRPRSVGPLYDLPMVVSDDQLKEILIKLHPTFPTRPPKTNYVDHALRMWGVNATFDRGAVATVEGRPQALSGKELRSLLLNDKEFASHWGAGTPPLLEGTEEGIKVRTQEGRATVSHVDHLVGSLSETGTELNHPVQLRGRTGDVRELVKYAFRSFDLNQKEYEWTALAWALYAKDNASWYTSAKQEITFDSMVRRMMRQGQPQGVCYGQHRIYSMAIILRVDEQRRADGDDKGLLSTIARQEVVDYLKQTTASLYRNQTVEGYWDANWPDPSVPVSDPTTDPLSRRVLATGHTLEWWAMAPKELLPPRETIIRAGQWLSRVVLEMDDRQIEKNYTFLTHAGRALALWRGKFPDEADKDFRQSATQPVFAMMAENGLLEQKVDSVHLKGGEPKSQPKAIPPAAPSADTSSIPARNAVLQRPVDDGTTGTPASSRRGFDAE